MTAALIGALRISLGLDTAQFNGSLKRVNANLAGFAKSMVPVLATAAAAAAAATVAMGVAVKGAIDHADELSKASQKAGVTVQALSRLEYAAKLSDVALGQLTGGLQKLSRGMLEAAKGDGPAKVFNALGVSVTDANGRLREGNAVFADLADRFSRMEDGSTKTALAIQIFGESGADLIPLLNAGADGLARMADESDRVGATIGGKTAKAAEDFNGSLTRIQTIMQGVVNKVMVAVLPALQDLADVLASPQFATGAQTLATNVITAMAKVLAWIADVKMHWNDLVQFIHHGVIAGVVNKRKGSANIEDRTTPGWKENRTLEGASGQLMISTTFDRLGAAKSFDSIGEMWSSLRDKLKDPLEIDLGDLTDASSKAVDKIALDVSAMNDALATTYDRIKDSTAAFSDMASVVSAGLGDALRGMLKGLIAGKGAVEGLTDGFKSLGDRLISMAVDQAIQGILSTLIGAFTGGGLGVGKGLTGAATYGLTGNGFYGVPGLATGGRLMSDGLVQVGERGRELLHLPRGASVIRNSDFNDHAGARGGRVRLELGPGLEASILDQSARQSVEIAKAYDSQLGRSIADKRRRGALEF